MAATAEATKTTRIEITQDGRGILFDVPAESLSDPKKWATLRQMISHAFKVDGANK